VFWLSIYESRSPLAEGKGFGLPEKCPLAFEVQPMSHCREPANLCHSWLASLTCLELGHLPLLGTEAQGLLRLRLKDDSHIISVAFYRPKAISS
jgi:hypothetical protein